MPEDYTDAAERLFAEADFLFEHGEWGHVTAEHLYGLSGECAVKSTLLKLGVAKAEVGQGKDFGGHIPEILRKVENDPLVRKNNSLITPRFAGAVGKLRKEMSVFSMSRRYLNQNDIKADIVQIFKANVGYLRKECDRAVVDGKIKRR